MLLLNAMMKNLNLTKGLELKRVLWKKFRPLSMIIMVSTLTIFSACKDDTNVDDDFEAGVMPPQFLSFFNDNDIDYELDPTGNPYVPGELIIRFDDFFTEEKFNQVLAEIATLNGITVDDIDVRECPCTDEDIRLLRYQRIGELEPTKGSMGDQDGDDDGLSADASAGITTSNNYITVPIEQILSNLPSNFPLPNVGIGQGYLNSNPDRTVIAILDSGFDFDHPQLANYQNFALWQPPTPDCYSLGYDFVNLNNQAIDDHGHGTQVAGVILNELEKYNAPVSIMPLKISDDKGKISLWDMLCAIRYATEKEADIVNISAGWYGAPNLLIQLAIQSNPQTLFVCSAGNEGYNTDIPVNLHFPSGFSSLVNLISVGALNGSGGNKANFSNYGINSILAAAPGVNLNTITPCDGEICDPMTIDVTGTSFSTPYVTAVAAAIMSCLPNPTPIELRNLKKEVLDKAIFNPSIIGEIREGKELNFNLIPPLIPCER
jgi:subtilisin family serine protease